MELTSEEMVQSVGCRKMRFHEISTANEADREAGIAWHRHLGWVISKTWEQGGEFFYQAIQPWRK